MIQYPISFFATAESAPGLNTLWSVESEGHELTCAIPPAFEGPGGGFSPEDLFAQALTNCFLATFKVYVEKSKLSFSSIEIRTDLKVDLDENKRPVMREADLNVIIRGGTSPDRLRTLAQKAMSSGFILNSVKTRLILNLEFKDE